MESIYTDNIVNTHFSRYKMDPEEIDIPNSNTTDNKISEPDIYSRLSLEFFTVVGVLSIISNFLLVFVILKYKKLRQEVTNMIILHVNVMAIIRFFTAALILRIVLTHDLLNNIDRSIFCAITEILSLSKFCINLFLLLLVNDWYLKVYYEHSYVKFCYTYRYLVFCIYIVFILLSSLMVYFCKRNISEYSHEIIMFAGDIFIILYVIVLNIIHQFKKRKLVHVKSSNVGLIITNIFFLLRCFPVSSFILAFFEILHPFLNIFFMIISYSGSIVSFLYLFKCDENFNIFIKKVFKCQCNDYNNKNSENYTYPCDVNGTNC